MPRTIKLTLAYDGTDFAGWQLQPGQRTLQGVVEEALGRITGQATRVAASGRTDAGVHALGQVVSFETASDLPVDVLQRALHAELPRDVAALEVEEAPAGFHARSDARRKRYRYVIHNHPVRDVFLLRYAWHVYRPLDAEAMHRSAQALVGTHDFASFQTSGSERETTERTVYGLTVSRQSSRQPPALPGDCPLISIDVEANGFLYNMVRNIVGTLVEVGQGGQSESWPAEVLAARDRRRAGQTAPPQGLFLVCVEY